jgi:hypothetical protein
MYPIRPSPGSSPATSLMPFIFPNASPPPQLTAPLPRNSPSLQQIPSVQAEKLPFPSRNPFSVQRSNSPSLLRNPFSSQHSIFPSLQRNPFSSQQSNSPSLQRNPFSVQRSNSPSLQRNPFSVQHSNSPFLPAQLRPAVALIR